TPKPFFDNFKPKFWAKNSLWPESTIKNRIVLLNPQANFEKLSIFPSKIDNSTVYPNQSINFSKNRQFVPEQFGDDQSTLSVLFIDWSKFAKLRPQSKFRPIKSRKMNAQYFSPRKRRRGAKKITVAEFRLKISNNFSSLIRLASKFEI
uniref:Ribosomal protein S18 n=1 Tax=Romanomermis culicivorax TaxID=13658 RepID=A0A915HP09_ROMCU